MGLIVSSICLINLRKLTNKYQLLYGKVLSALEYPADEPVVPRGWTGIKQYNQRTTTKNGNTGRSSSTSQAKVFDCYSCESSFSHRVDGPNPVEPLYDSIKAGLKYFLYKLYTFTLFILSKTYNQNVIS